MAYEKIKVNGEYLVNKLEFVCDGRSDIPMLPIDIQFGSVAFVTEDSSVWILNSAGQWVEQSSD